MGGIVQQGSGCRDAAQFDKLRDAVVDVVDAGGIVEDFVNHHRSHQGRAVGASGSSAEFIHALRLVLSE